MLGFLFTFLMAVIILVTSLYAFGEINQAARDLSAQAQLREVAARVSLGVQETLQVAGTRLQSRDTANATLIHYAHVIDVPAQVQGHEYTVTLDKDYIRASIPTRAVNVEVITFNAAVSLPSGPPSDTCSGWRYIACTLKGSNVGNKAQIVMTYDFDGTSGWSSAKSVIEIA